jgi:hypothetical protein
LESLPLNLLIFPLVGGYYITTRLEASKFISQRLTSQSIFFNAVLIGIPLMVISLVITTLLTHILPEKVSWIKLNIFPLKDDYFGTCFLSVLIAFCYTKFKNWKADEAGFILKAIDEIGNELELLVAHSFKESKLIQLTLKNDKIYIGWAEVLPKPSHNQYIQLIPLFSGFRDERKELVITTNYSLVYSELIQKGKIRDIQEVKMNLVVMANEIVSASMFDFEIYESFVEKRKVSK